MEFASLFASPTGAADLALPTVLIIDDNAPLVEGLRELLEEEGYIVATADDGRAALDQLRRGLRPCVILLDLMMPGMNGWAFRRAQLADTEIQDIPVIVMTAGAFAGAAIKAQLGDVEFLPKPASLRELLDVVRRHCAEMAP